MKNFSCLPISKDQRNARNVNNASKHIRTMLINIIRPVEALTNPTEP
jgi:hypothetical protein